MNKTTKIVAILLGVAVVAFVAVSIINSITKANEMAKYSEWDYIEGNSLNGNIADHIIGNKDAKVKIIEYADFQCSACAVTFPYIHSIVEEYGDQVALIFRTYVISYHPNGNAVATAATAAGLQGYFEDYATLAFSRQNEWYDLEGTERDNVLAGYLKTVSNGQADMEKYRSDLKSAAIKDKISFDRSLAIRVKLEGTPLIFINKEKYEVPSTKESTFKADFKAKIDEALKNAS